MNNADRVIPAEVRRLLDEHLDSVERALADSGVSFSDRRSICDEVETQACEMLWPRADGKPTEQQMRAVLAELDDPEAYREAVEPNDHVRPVSVPVDSPKVHSFGLCAFLLLPASVVLLFLSPFHSQAGGEVAGSIYFGVVAFLSIVFATLAIRDIRRQPDRYFGIALAIFGALSIPLLFLNTVVILNVSEINPYSTVLLKQTLIRKMDEMQQRVQQDHRERHEPAVSIEPPNLARDETSALKLSETERNSGSQTTRHWYLF